MEKTKFIATFLLILMISIFILAQKMQGQAIYWGYIGAFAEAAMIGAIADWFAVVALFRHPLGIPIPHTAIIPANQDRIAKRLADFLCTKFLDTELILKYLNLNNPVKVLSHWLARPKNARKVAGYMCVSIEHILPLLESDQLKKFVQEKAIQSFEKADLASTSKELLNLLVEKNQHQALLDHVVIQVGKLLSDETVREQISTAVASEVKYLRFIGLDFAAGRYATRTMVATVAHLMEEMAQDPNHPFRKRFETYTLQLISELESDERRQEQLRALQQKIIQHPQIQVAFSQLWSQAMEWIKEDCRKPYPITQNHIEKTLQNIALQLQGSPQTLAWLNEQIFSIITLGTTRYRRHIHQYIINTVKMWSPQEMGENLEKYIGRDLQFIRINGTIVGGLVGLLIHSILQFI